MIGPALNDSGFEIGIDLGRNPNQLTRLFQIADAFGQVTVTHDAYCMARREDGVIDAIGPRLRARTRTAVLRRFARNPRSTRKRSKCVWRAALSTCRSAIKSPHGSRSASNRPFCGLRAPTYCHYQWCKTLADLTIGVRPDENALRIPGASGAITSNCTQSNAK